MPARPDRRRKWLPIVALLLAGCAFSAPQASARQILLLAPFEGRLREVGYDALYAARLALADAGAGADATGFAGAADIELLPLDDGGTPERAAQRAQAAALDPRIMGAIVLGLSAGTAQAQQSLGDIPTLIVGNWATDCATPAVHIVSAPLPQVPPLSPELALGSAQVGDYAALPGYQRLAQAADIPLDGVRLLSVGTPPDASFITRYRASDAFAPEQPGLLATLTYDSVRWLVGAVQVSGTRAEVLNALTTTTPYQGYHTLALGACYSDLPVHTYAMQDGSWAEVPP